MGTFSPTYEEIALQCIFGDDHATPFPDIFWICLFTSDPEVNDFDDEPSGNAYARVEVANTTAEWVVVASTAENVNACTFPEATGAWGAVTHWGMADHVTNATAANLITSAALSSPTSPVLGDTPEFAPGTLVVGAD